MSEIRNREFQSDAKKHTTVTKIFFVVAYIIFKVAVIISSLAKIQDHFCHDLDNL